MLLIELNVYRVRVTLNGNMKKHECSNNIQIM